MTASSLDLEIVGTHTIVVVDVRQQSRAGGGGGPVGPFQTLGELRTSRGRVAEWPVADPILRVLVLTRENATAKSIARMRRENREDAGRSDRTRPAAG